MKIEIIQADITTVQVDAIVNAANTSLLGGGGVDGAIHRKGGKVILDECMAIRDRQGNCKTGNAVITTAGNLPAKYVIHTVGPVWNGGNNKEEQLLENCYINSLKLAVENNVKTIAFPNISTGIYHFPKEKAAAIAIQTIQNFPDKDYFDKIVFVCFDDENFQLYKNYQTNQYNKIKQAFLGLAIGDALGVPVEFYSREQLENRPIKDMIGYGSWNQPPGTWSDDSSLTFCTAESLLDGYDAEKMLTLFVRWYKEGYWGAHHKLFDIGQTTRLSIARFIKNGFSNMNGEFDVDSNGNGSLMRILPMAFYLTKIQDIDTRYNVIKEVSSLTHAHFRSVLSCFIYVEFAIHLINGNKPQDAYNSMQKTVNDFVAKMEFNQKEVELFDRILKMNIASVDVDFIRSSGYVLSTLEASLWCVLNSTTYVEATLKAVNLGGDTDTTGTVTGGIAAIAYGIDDVPDRWLTTLARKEDIINLASQLESKLNSE